MTERVYRRESTYVGFSENIESSSYRSWRKTVRRFLLVTSEPMFCFQFEECKRSAVIGLFGVSRILSCQGQSHESVTKAELQNHFDNSGVGGTLLPAV